MYSSLDITCKSECTDTIELGGSSRVCERGKHRGSTNTSSQKNHLEGIEILPRVISLYILPPTIVCGAHVFFPHSVFLHVCLSHEYTKDFHRLALSLYALALSLVHVHHAYTCEKSDYTLHDSYHIIIHNSICLAAFIKLFPQINVQNEYFQFIVGLKHGQPELPN